jgi:hypothetical protein
MNQVLQEADRVLAVLSAAYFASQYARDEWTAALVRDQPDRLESACCGRAAHPAQWQGCTRKRRW